MGNCKQLEHLAVSGIIGPVNLDPRPASLRRLDINLDMQCAYSRGGYTYDGYGLEKPTWTISYSSLPALTSLSSPTDSHEVMKQVIFSHKAPSILQALAFLHPWQNLARLNNTVPEVYLSCTAKLWQFGVRTSKWNVSYICRWVSWQVLQDWPCSIAL